MIKYILGRILTIPTIMFVVSIILFVIILQVPPEARANIYIPSTGSNISQEEYQSLVEATIKRYGLDQPFYIQYIKWGRNFLSGDWGYSPTWRQSVREGFVQRIPATFELVLFSFLPTFFLAVIFGGIAALFENKAYDHGIRVLAFIGWALPPFILGLLLLNVLYARFHWFPPERLSLWANQILYSNDFHSYTGLLTIDALLNRNPELLMDALRHLVLPGITLSFVQWSLLTRVMRSSLLDALRQDYITTARSKGLPERRVVNVHAGRNGILPVISTAGSATTMFISNIMIVEIVFTFNGVGRWAVKSALSYDIPVTLAFVLMMSAVVVLANLATDILYVLIDPRIGEDK
jgi:peptide/nickel transport system permease protein